MKRKAINVLAFLIMVVVAFSSLSVVEYYYAVKDNRIPKLSIKSANKEKQFFQYNALFYKTYKCYSGEISVSSYKEPIPVCPKLIVFDENNNFTTKSGLLISRENFQLLFSMYTYGEIEEFDNNDDVSNGIILSREFGNSFHEKVPTIKDMEINSETISVHTFQTFEKNDIYGNYGWVMKYQDSEYYKCTKTDSEGKYLFSDYNNGKCSDKWNYYKFSDEWCSIAKTSDKQVIKQYVIDFCK